MSIEGVSAGLLAKFGMAKVLSFGAAFIGAAIMLMFRPPKSRKDLFYHACSAFAGSALFGGTALALAVSWTGLDKDTLIPAVYGIIGALSWGFFGGLASWRDDKLAKDPLQAIKDVKDVV
jgi:hypothetical protein